ncbi:MAG: MFS transporter [Bacillota bacterium]
MTDATPRRGPTLRAPRSIWALGAIAFVNLVGFSFIWPMTTIYIHQVLGRPLSVAGVVLMFFSGASFLGQLVGGTLFDRAGGRLVIEVGLFLGAAAIAVPGLVQSWPLYVGAMIVFGFLQSLVFPALNAMAATTWPEGGREAFNLIYVANNAGVAVGTALGGLLASLSFRFVFLGAALVLLLSAFLALGLIRDRRFGDGAAAAVRPAAGGPGRSIPWLPIGFLLVSHLLLWLFYVQWASTLAVYMQGLGISLPAYGLLWTLNGLVIVLGQPLVSRFVRLVRSLPAQLLTGVVLFLGASGLLLTSTRYSVFTLIMVVLTLGEMLLWPGIPAAVDQLAPPERRGFLQGSLGSATAAGRMVGPLVGGLIYDRLGQRALILALPVMLVFPLVSLLFYGRAMRRRGPATAATGSEE